MPTPVEPSYPLAALQAHDPAARVAVAPTHWQSRILAPVVFGELDGKNAAQFCR